jgi:trans-aconitate methyltransferase
MQQTWDADRYMNNAAFVAAHGEPVVELLQPKPGERILDLGCGDGSLTSKLEAFGASLHGVDASPDMIAAAQQRGLCAEVLSGENLRFSQEFDAVFSNAALHWMKNAEQVIQGVSRALKTPGRFVGEFGGEGNIHILISAMSQVFARHPDFGEFINPWYFPSVNEYKKKLEDNGFAVTYIELIPRPTPLASGIVEWLKIFTSGITSQLDTEQKSAFFAEVEAYLKPRLCKHGQWVADYVRLRFAALKH